MVGTDGITERTKIEEMAHRPYDILVLILLGEILMRPLSFLRPHQVKPAARIG